jgi:hypothetical protein
VFSVGFGKFVVLGRLARQCVPFFCLVTAYWLERLRTTPGERASWAFRGVIAVVTLQAIFNFYTPMTQVFPDGFSRLASRATKTHRASVEGGTYRVLRTRSIYPEPRRIFLPEHSTLLEAPHPSAYLPLQYEGYTPSQREKLRSRDIRMRLVYIADSVTPAAPAGEAEDQR